MVIDTSAIVREGCFGEAGGVDLDLWLHKTDIEVVAVTAKHSDQARRTRRRYGKARHPASLTYGGCFSYALATSSGEPRLYKGNDFKQTDIEAA